MSIILKAEVKDKIKVEYQTELDKNKEVAAVIKKKLAGKYNISIKTIRKILSSASDKKSKVAEPDNKSKAKTYIITSWDIRTSIDPKFIDILTQLAKYYQAELYIQNLSSKNNDDWFVSATKKKCKQDLVTELAKYLFQFVGDESLSSNLQFKQIDVSPTAASVISGFEGIFDKSTILCGLIKELKTEKSLVVGKQIMSTGSIGKLDAKLEDYNLLPPADFSELEKVWNRTKENTKAFQVAKELIEPSALIVDVVDDKVFFTRFITMRKSGVVYDRNLKFSYGKTKPEVIRPKALIIGDFHSIETCPKNLQAITDIAKEYKPEVAILHDFTSFLSINHHEWNNYINVIKAPTLEAEWIDANKNLDYLETLFPKTYYICSNHCNFLTTFLADETKYKLNPQNYKKALELRIWQLETNRHPIIKFLELDKRKKVTFVSQHQDLILCGNVHKHGHENLLGVKAGFKTMAKAFNYKYVAAHLHGVEIYAGAAQAGTSSKLRLGYNSGGVSNWVNGHVLEYEDGTFQHVIVLDGKLK